MHIGFSLALAVLVEATLLEKRRVQVLGWPNGNSLGLVKAPKSRRPYFPIWMIAIGGR